MRVLIGDEGRKRQHTRNDAYQNDRLSVSSYFEDKKKYLDMELVQETIIDSINSCCATTEKDLRNNTAICDLDILIVLLAKFL